MMKCRRRQATKPQKLKKIVNGRFFVFCWWKRKRLKNNRFHIPGRNIIVGTINHHTEMIDLRVTVTSRSHHIPCKRQSCNARTYVRAYVRSNYSETSQCTNIKLGTNYHHPRVSATKKRFFCNLRNLKK